MTKAKPVAPAVVHESLSLTKIMMAGIAVLFSLLIGLITWLGSNLIAGQASMREEIIAARGQLAQYRSDIDNQRTRQDRTNDRQTELADRITRIETRLEGFRK